MVCTAFQIEEYVLLRLASRRNFKLITCRPPDIFASPCPIR